MIFLGERCSALFIDQGKAPRGKKLFTILPSGEEGNFPYLPANPDRKLFKKIQGTNIVVIPDIRLLHHGKEKKDDVTFTNSIIDDLLNYLARAGVESPVVISSLASPEILFHYYSRKLKFFPDDRTYILSGDDDMVFEARLRGRGLAAARLIDFDTFRNSKNSYLDCDQLITFTSDPYAFRFEDEIAGTGHPSLSRGHEESFALQEGTREGKTWKGIYNICEMVSELYRSNALPLPGLLTPQEVQTSEENRLARTASTLNLVAGMVTGAVSLLFLSALVRFFILSPAESGLDDFKKKEPSVYNEVAAYGGKIPLIPESRQRLKRLDSMYIRLDNLLRGLESHAESANLQITGISLREKNYILIKGYTEAPGVAAELAGKIKGAELLSTEIFRTSENTYTSFRIVVPGDVKWK